VRIDANQSQQKKADYYDASNSNFLSRRSSNHNCCVYYLHFQTPARERHNRANSKTLTIAPSSSSANGFLVVLELGPTELVIPWSARPRELQISTASLPDLSILLCFLVSMKEDSGNKLHS
jgi:hypothetical protein